MNFGAVPLLNKQKYRTSVAYIGRLASAEVIRELVQ